MKRSMKAISTVMAAVIAVNMMGVMASAATAGSMAETAVVSSSAVEAKTAETQIQLGGSVRRSGAADENEKYCYTEDGRVIVYTKVKMDDNTSSGFNVPAEDAYQFFPGAIVKTENGGNTTVSGYDRTESTITIEGVKMQIDPETNKPYPSSATYDPSNYSSYKKALETLLSHADKSNQSAQFNIQSTYVSNESDIRAAFNVDYDVIDKLNIDFSSVFAGREVAYMESYSQNSFSVVTDPGNGNAQEILNGSSDTDTYAMINTASYGRRVFVTYTSKDTSIDVKGTIEAAMNNKDGKLDADIQKKLSNISCNLYVCGGSNAADLVTSNISVEEAMKIIRDPASGDVDNAVCLSYTARDLATGQTVTANNGTEKYRTNIEVKESTPLTFETASNSVNGRVYDFHVDLSYDMVVPKGSAAAAAAMRNNPSSVTEDANGMVRVHVTENSKITSSGKQNVVNIPASADMSTLKVKVGYNGLCADKNHDNICNYDFSKFTGNVGDIKINCDAGTKLIGFGYWTEGKISVNGQQVTAGRG